MSHLSAVPSDPDELRAWLAQRADASDAPERPPDNPAIVLPRPPRTISALTIEVTLEETEPRVWRRLVVPGDTTLGRLHDFLQLTMGWSGRHLHRYWTGQVHASPHFVTGGDLRDGQPGTPETMARLDQVLRAVGDSIRYEYDFGDGWEHDVRLVDVGALDGEPRPRLIDGAGACPPEDVGGPEGFDDVARWVRNGRPTDDVPAPFDSADEAIAWLPDGWHPDELDLEATDRRLELRTSTSELMDRVRPPALDAVLHLSPGEMARVVAWVEVAAGTSLSPADLDDLTAPYRTLLAAVGGGVQLSASGYLPPALVRELCPALGVDPILAGKANRESNIRPLLMFRKTAQQAGLLHTAKGVLVPTAAGKRLADDPARLWRHVSKRLPLGRGGLQVEVGWFTLLALAGGVGRHEVYDVVHRLCVDAGWLDESGAPVDRWTVIDLAHPPQTALLGPRWNALTAWPAWVPAAAASVVFGRKR